jgi:hypothetical protein
VRLLTYTASVTRCLVVQRLQLDPRGVVFPIDCLHSFSSTEAIMVCGGSFWQGLKRADLGTGEAFAAA